MDVLGGAAFGLFIGVLGTGLGGAAAFLTRGRGKLPLAAALQFSAGMMLAVVCFDLLPEAFLGAPPAVVMLSFLAGCALLALCNALVGAVMNTDAPEHRSADRRRLRRLCAAMALGVALHNFPEGLAIGSGLASGGTLGLSLSLAILLHDIPEGMALAIPAEAGGMTPLRAMLFAAMTGIPTGLGALIGGAVYHISPAFLSVCLAAAGGAMCQVVLADMLPESAKLYKGPLPALGAILGLVAGILICTGM